MRHVQRTHRVDLDWLFERVLLDDSISLRYVRTNEQMADILTKGSFTAATWQSLLKLLGIGPQQPLLESAPNAPKGNRSGSQGPAGPIPTVCPAIPTIQQSESTEQHNINNTNHDNTSTGIIDYVLREIGDMEKDQTPCAGSVTADSASDSQGSALAMPPTCREEGLHKDRADSAELNARDYKRARN